MTHEQLTLLFWQDVAQKREELVLRMILCGQFPSAGWSIGEEFCWEKNVVGDLVYGVTLFPVPPPVHAVRERRT